PGQGPRGGSVRGGLLTRDPERSAEGSRSRPFFEHNVEHMIWQRLWQVETRWWRRPLLAVEWRKMRRYEARACRWSTVTIAVSETDRALLAAGAPSASVFAVPTGVDVAYFAPNGRAEVPGHLVFTGSMDW